MVVAQYDQQGEFASSKGLAAQLSLRDRYLTVAEPAQTLILSYVTIPARSRVSQDVLSSPACFAHYTVREVVLRRFIPARMRD